MSRPTNCIPTNFLTAPNGNQPSGVGANLFRKVPKFVSNGLGGAGRRNGDTCPNPKNPKQRESKKLTTDDKRYKKKNKKAEQSKLGENVENEKIEIISIIKDNPALVRESEQSGRDQDAQRSMNNLVDQIQMGNKNPGIGTEPFFNGVFELRGKNRARVYYHKLDKKIEILGQSVKNNQPKARGILKNMDE